MGIAATVAERRALEIARSNAYAVVACTSVFRNGILIVPCEILHGDSITLFSRIDCSRIFL